MLRQLRPSVRPFVCPSVTRVDCIKTAEHIIEILSLSDRSIILVLSSPRVLRKSDGSTPNTGEGASDFRQICSYISEMVVDRGIFTMIIFVYHRRQI